MDLQIEKFLQTFNSIDFNQINDHPNILIAAGFWDQDRYSAAKTCYKFMRSIDDLIDDHKAINKTIVPEARKEFARNINSWLKMIMNSDDCNHDQKELIEIIEKFRIPRWPIEAFANSMIYDINNDGFPTLEAFLGYAQGASVGPASIFVHLTGLINHNGIYKEPLFDVREAATPCAIFSYLVHIIRDFQKDQLNNLNYFADDIIARNHLSRHDLKEIAFGHPVSDNFRNLIKEYYTLAENYRLKTLDVIKNIRPLVEPRYQLGLDIIFNLYLMVYERIDIYKGKFTSEELNPTSEETKRRVYETIMKFKSE